MQISAIQFISDKNIERSMQKAERFIEKESELSDLIIFPEQFLGGLLEENEAKSLISRFRKLARDNKIDIVPGSILAKRGKSVYNTSHYIDSKGRILCRYDKNSPWKSEKITKGTFPKSFRTKFGKTAIIICWDLASPNIAARLSRQNLNLIICPSMWWEGSELKMEKRFAGRFIDSLCQARAYECRAIVAYANSGGTINGKNLLDISAGRTQVTVPFHGVIASAKGRNEQVVRAEINLNILKKAKDYLG